MPFVIVVELVQGNNVRGTSINICMTSVSETLNMLSGKVFSLSLFKSVIAACYYSGHPTNVCS